MPRERSAIIACIFGSRMALRAWSIWRPTSAFEGVFEPLRDPAYFAQVHVDPDLGTVTWPNGADLDPDVLYGRVTGTPILQEHDVHLAH